MPVADSQTLEEGRRVYFAENGLPSDGGYDDRWVVIKVGRVPVFAFPNTEDRRRAVPCHDLHHVLTGYRTDLMGEAEVGAWELASDCSSSRAATYLNLQVFGFMLPLHRERLRRAFVRGCRSRNLYRAVYDSVLLARRVGEVRSDLGLDLPAESIARSERAAWRRWSAIALGCAWGALLPIALIGWWWLAR
jgi:hypothetical protein